MFNKTLHLHFIKLMYNTSVKSKNHDKGREG